MAERRPEVILTFCKDGIRRLKEAMRRAEAPDFKVEDQRLLENIHSVKGAASMVQGADPIVELLHALEQKLTIGRSRPTASIIRSDLKRAILLLQMLQDQYQKGSTRNPSASISTHEALGLEMEVKGKRERRWISLQSLLHAIPKDELGTRATYCHQGKWLPVVGEISDSDYLMGLVVQLPFGRLVIRTLEITPVQSAEELSESGYQKLAA